MTKPQEKAASTTATFRSLARGLPGRSTACFRIVRCIRIAVGRRHPHRLRTGWGQPLFRPKQFCETTQHQCRCANCLDVGLLWTDQFRVGIRTRSVPCRGTSRTGS